MHTQESLEGKLLHILSAPERFERTITSPPDFEALLVQSFFRSYFLARHAWQNVRTMALSWRDCHVVAAGSGIRINRPDDAVTEIFGYNVKTHEQAGPNIHAEQMIIAQAERLQMILTNIVVVGEPQTDNSSGLENPVLAPCDYRCTHKILHTDTTGAYTVITCINPLTGATQFIPIENLKERNWHDIPLIEVESLNDEAEWREKSAQIIEDIVTPDRIDNLKRAHQAEHDALQSRYMEQIIRLIAQQVIQETAPKFTASVHAPMESDYSVSPELPTIYHALELRMPQTPSPEPITQPEF